MELNVLVSFVSYGLVLTYGIFMLIYLNDAQKCDDVLTERDKNFRKAAVVITWIEVILTGLVTLALLLMLIAGPQNKYMSNL